MTTDTMRSVVWEGKPFHMSIKDVPKAQIAEPDDAVVRIMTAGICGTDLHIFHGKLGSATPPWPMGHEATGIVVEIGAGVESLKVGDRVVVPAGPDNGRLSITASDLQFTTGFGLGPDFGNLDGCQGKLIDSRESFKLIAYVLSC